MSISPTHGPGTPRCAQRGLETVTMFNMPMNSLSLQETLDAIGRHIDAGEQGFVVTPNVDHAVEFDENPDFRQAYYDAAMVLVDGMYILWAGRLFGKPLKAKISGSDLIYWLSEYAAEKSYSIYLLGAKEGVAEKAGKKLMEKYPGLKVAGSYSPPLGFEKNPVENQKAIDLVRESGADICFVALGAPKQDLWSWRYHKLAGAKLYLGVGASFDFVAGTIQRAPVWMQNLGLEWVWRILQEPSRMAHRYLIRDSKFLLLLWREWKSEW
jgi:N-acetylglucosaminyldiphosphoundecaprenol N-acetyl-beta-D-mannosaminyltransferase